MGSSVGALMQRPPELDNLDAWIASEAAFVEEPPIRNAVLNVCQSIDEFVRWPRRELLLWKGCDRVNRSERKQKYHTYPVELRKVVRHLTGQQRIDARSNGPAVVAFFQSGGD